MFGLYPHYLFTAITLRDSMKSRSIVVIIYTYSQWDINFKQYLIYVYQTSSGFDSTYSRSLIIHATNRSIIYIYNFVNELNCMSSGLDYMLSTLAVTKCMRLASNILAEKVGWNIAPCTKHTV
jgi:hypothetical protein